MISKLKELLDESEEMHVIRKATNLEKADFLILNGVTVPPVKVGALVKDKRGDEYIVDGFKHEVVRLSPNIITSKTVVKVIHAEDKDRTVVSCYPYSVDEFLARFTLIESPAS